MKKVMRYLGHYWAPILFAIVLLFVQAACDLNLPNYMSQIVNVGLQQGGVENASPDAISAKGMTFLQTFMDESEKADVNASYSLKSVGELENSYPLNSTEEIYTLNSGVSTETRSHLNEIFGQNTWTFINTMKSLQAQSGSSSSMMGNTGSGSTSDLSNIDFSKLYQMMPMLQKIPASVIDEARTEAQQNQQSLLEQSGTILAKNFYEELGVNTDSIQQNYIMHQGFLMVLITLASGIASVLVGLISARVAAGISRDLRRDIFSNVEDFSNSEFDKFGTASLITRTTNDVTQIQMFVVFGIRMICYAPIMGIGGVIMAVKKSGSMTWIIALACALLIALILVIFTVAMPKFKIMQKLVDRLNLVARENLSGLMVTRAFSNQKFEEDRFDTANTNLTNTQLFVNRVMVCMMPTMMFIMNGVSLLIVWVGAHQISESAMQVGDMMAFIQYAMQIIMSFLMISVMFIMFPRAAVAGDRIAEVLETKPSIGDPEDPESFDESQKGVIEFKDVCFRYEGADEDVLNHISFTANPGKTTAFIGSTGSGKSTLINLIPRFYDVTSGEILVDGRDIRKVPQKELRSRIGYVPQKGVLLSGTIASNLRYGAPDASDEKIEKVAEVAQASEFINTKPQKMEDSISEGGNNVSGGQKQRLSIARALATNAEIYLFDDSFSALDFKTDAALRKALRLYTSTATILLVAQRVSTIMHADQIIVLEEGKIVGCGTHHELLETCPTYYEIASSQLSKEELE